MNTYQSEQEQLANLILQIRLLEADTSASNLGTEDNPITIQYHNKPASFFKVPSMFGGHAWVEMTTDRQYGANEVKNANVITALDSIAAGFAAAPVNQELDAHRKKVLQAHGKLPVTTPTQTNDAGSQGSGMPSGARDPSSQFRMPSDDVWMPDEPSKVSNDWSVPDSEFTKNYPRTLPSGSVKPKTSQQAKRTPSATPVAKPAAPQAKAAPKPQKSSSGLSKSDQTFRQQAADSAAKLRAQAKQAAPGSALQQQLQKHAEIANKEALGLKEKVLSLKSRVNQLNEDEIADLRAQQAAEQKAAEQAYQMYTMPNERGERITTGKGEFRRQSERHSANANELGKKIARLAANTPPASSNTQQSGTGTAQGAAPSNQDNKNFILQSPILPVHDKLNIPQTDLNFKLGYNTQQVPAAVGTVPSNGTQPAQGSTKVLSTKSQRTATPTSRQQPSGVTQKSTKAPVAKSQDQSGKPAQGAPVVDKSTWPSQKQTTTPPAQQSWEDRLGHFNATNVGESTMYSDDHILTRIIGLAGIK